MRKKKYLILVFLICIFTGCHNDDSIGIYEVAIIESTSNKENSLVTYYDQDLNIVGKKYLHYAELGTNFCSPAYDESHVYIVPRGLQGRHNEKKVIGLDLKTGKESTYHVDKTNILCTAVNQGYIFAGSNLNGVSYLSRIGREEGMEKDLTFEEQYLSSLAATDHYVFAFLSSTDYENMYAKINIYDVDSLVLEKSIDITEYGINQSKNCISQDKLYFSNAYDKYDQRTNILGVLDLHDFSLAKVELEFNSPDDIQIVDENKLLIACTNIVQADGTHIVMYEEDTGKQTTYDLGITIMNIQVMGEKLFVLDPEHSLYVYDLNQEMKLIHSVKHILTEGIYCSNLFINKKYQ